MSTFHDLSRQVALLTGAEIAEHSAAGHAFRIMCDKLDRFEAFARQMERARLPQTAVRCYPDRIACAGSLTETVDGGAVIDLPPKRNGYVRVAVVKARVPREASHAMAERIKESGACDVVLFAEPGDDILFYDMPDRR